MRNKNTIWVSDNQAQAIDQAIMKRVPVKVNGATINTVDISGIWPEDIWYEIHPDLKPAPVAEPVLQIKEAIKPDEKGLHYQAYLKNKEAMAKGEKVRFYAKDGKIHEQDSWNHDTGNKTVRGKLVKKSISKQKWNSFYSASPGYHLLSDDGDRVTVAFTIVGEVPHHVEDLTEYEIKKIKI